MLQRDVREPPRAGQRLLDLSGFAVLMMMAMMLLLLVGAVKTGGAGVAVVPAAYSTRSDYWVDAGE